MRVIIVGAGFGGIAAAIELRRHGFDDVTLLEAAPELGGTWHYNTYPGSACDVPSHFYSYSYAQRRDWSRLCSPQPEILDYLRGIAADFDIQRRIVTGAKVTACEWDDAACQWTVRTEDGTERTAAAVVLATGQLNQPAMPRIDGLDQFTGHTFHSARWDHDYDLRGKRVAVIGTGASAVQFVPEIAKQAAQLTVFQRSGNWFLPRRNRAYPAVLKALFQLVPGLQEARRQFLFRYMESITAAIRHPSTVGWLGRLRAAVFMRWQLRDREVRRKAWPDYTFGCKRVLFSSAFLPALQRKNVELVNEPIARMTPDGPETADGIRHVVDCVIYGTGFKTNDFMFPMEITGTAGRSLREVWAAGAHAHLGITVPGFPSMFILYGPNTNTSGGSIIFYLEAQAGYLRQALCRARDTGAAAIDVRAEVEAASDREVQARFAGTAWTQCDSWYRDGAGRIVANWPGYMREYAQLTRTLAPAQYQLIHRAEETDQPEPVRAEQST
ncbi:MAG TPA: NAD(P)/FAD-dependent oxidoreductase [Pseudonocardia sp.]|uniref:flavin-containing monooxygenase n=1 Tax=Pseudonocardia sp. TaxID=60912 RepID=UPI002BB2744C|nr:NAD(P)/FAD-dependent oxidoreductase [Pseudonocardia sp.]HTF51042.1 NAD(P)/FAD-dependent oxidoreductase [Pseudonocardia sp.]